MEFKINKKSEQPNKSFYDKEVLDISYNFAKGAYKEFGGFVRACVLFGSTARKKTMNPEGDIDILLIVDDLNVGLTPDIVEAYRIITQKMIADISTRIHVTTLKFTTFWEYMRLADPIAVNILRDGVSLIDTGFFDPMQALLFQGRIRPSPEAVWSYYVRAPATLQNSKWHMMQAVIDMYWAVTDAGHAMLMRTGQIPPTPEHIADLLDQILVKTNQLHPKYVEISRNFYKLSKMIFHHEIAEITGPEIDQYYKDATDFVQEAKRFLDKTHTFEPRKIDLSKAPKDYDM